MINDILVFDDIISSSYQDYLEHTLLGEAKAEWLILNDISYSSVDLKHTVTNPGLVHPLKLDNQIKSALYNLILPMVFASVDQVKFSFREVLQARCFLQFPSSVSSPNNPHVDLIFPHLVCLYYVNDSDGDTLIYNQTLNDVSQDQVTQTSFTIKQRVTPRKGRVVVFDGKYYHSSSNPTGGQRCIINFDVV